MVHIARILQSRGSAVTEIPQPAHNRVVRNGQVGELDRGARTKLGDRGAQVRSRMGKLDVLRLDEGMRTTIHICHSQGHGVGTVSCVGVCGCLQGGGTAVTKVPQPGIDGHRAGGNVLESNGGWGAANCVKGHEIGHRIFIRRDGQTSCALTAIGIRYRHSGGVGSRYCVGVGRIPHQAAGAIAERPAPGDKCSAARRGSVGEGHGMRCATIRIRHGDRHLRRRQHGDVAQRQHCVAAAQDIRHNQPHWVRPRRVVAVRRVLQGGAVAIAKGPLPGHQGGVRDGGIGEAHAHGHTRAHEAQVAGEPGNRMRQADILLPHQGVAAAVDVADNQGHVVLAVCCVAVNRVHAHHRAVAISEIPFPVVQTAAGSRGIGKPHGSGRTSQGVGREEIRHGQFSGSHHFAGAALAAVGIRHGEAEGIKPGGRPGMAGVPGEALAAIAEIPGPGHQGGSSGCCLVCQGDGERGAIRRIAHRKGWHRRSQDGNHIAPHPRGGTAQDVGHCQCHGVNARRAIGMAGVLGRGSGSVAKIP